KTLTTWKVGALCGALAGSLGISACTGQVVGPEGGPMTIDPTTGEPTTTPPPDGTPGVMTPRPEVKPPGTAARCTAEVIAQRALRRLTNTELEASLRATFGLDKTAWPSPSLVPDPASGDGFNNNGERLLVGDEYEKRLVETGKDIATVVTSAAHLSRLLPCAATGNEACATTFVDSIGSKLFRRPVTAVERERYVALSRKIKTAGGDFKTWVYWATVGLIKSPNTLYRSELGEATTGGKYKLGPYEVASALSYAYTGGPPSASLLQLASSNRLGTADDVEAAARGLVFAANGQVQPAFREQVLRFADQWLGLSPLGNINKDKMAFPDFTPDVQDALGEEFRRYFAGVLIDEKGKPGDLLTAPYTFVNATLSKFYGFGAAPGADFVKVARPANAGVGLMAQGAILSIAAANKTTSPTKRGHLVRERLLCQVVPPPPAVVDPLPEPTEAETTRQRYEELHAKDPGCKGCHNLMDPIGFGLEKLDATGRFRAMEGRFPINDSGKVSNTSTGDIEFSGASELAAALGKLPEVSDCMADFATAYTHGIEHKASGCMARAAADDMKAGKIGFLDFMVKMARSESFRVRVP
ncbi:MAG TPA: DUF1588 domain-containing protein, partial [Polyangia bacterium]